MVLSSRETVHDAVNNFDFDKINIIEYALWEGGGGHSKAYAVYTFINVDNCERPLTDLGKYEISVNHVIIGTQLHSTLDTVCSGNPLRLNATY